MQWLDTLKNLMYESTLEDARELWPPLPGCTQPHYNLRYEHVKHVEHYALKLWEKYGGDRDVVLAAVWAHDITKSKGNHAKTGAQWAAQNLAAIGFPAEKVEDVVYAISVHSGWDKTGLTHQEAKILWDSDKLAHFGPAYFMDLVFLCTSKKQCEKENRPDVIKFHETASMENFLVRFSGFEAEVGYDDFDHTMYFEESKSMLYASRTALRGFYLALKEQLT